MSVPAKRRAVLAGPADAALKGIDLRLLAILDTLLIERNVTRTAARLAMTQSAVSHALANLRRTFDDPLFVPTRGGMAPTTRALELAEPLRSALENVRRVFALARTFDPKRAENVFRIATNDYVSFVLLAPVLARLRELAPRVRLQVVAIDPATDWQRLDEGALDCAIAYFRDIPGALHSRSLFEERYCCVARRGHPALRGRLTLARYVELDHIVMTPYITGRIDGELAARGLERRVALAIPNFLLIPELVARTDLVATMGERVARHYGRRLPLAVLPLPLPMERVRISLVWHPRKHSEDAHRWLRGVLAEVAADV